MALAANQIWHIWKCRNNLVFLVLLPGLFCTLIRSNLKNEAHSDLAQSKRKQTLQLQTTGQAKADRRAYDLKVCCLIARASLSALIGEFFWCGLKSILSQVFSYTQAHPRIPHFTRQAIPHKKIMLVCFLFILSFLAWFELSWIQSYFFPLSLLAIFRPVGIDSSDTLFSCLQGKTRIPTGRSYFPHQNLLELGDNNPVYEHETVSRMMRYMSFFSTSN